MRWRDEDYLGFGRRLAQRHEEYVDSIESVHTYVIRKIGEMEEPHKANPVWILGKLNAERPEKYKGTTPQINIDARSISAELAQIGRAMLPGQAPAQAPTTEGGAGLSAGAEEV